MAPAAVDPRGGGARSSGSSRKGLLLADLGPFPDPFSDLFSSSSASSSSAAAQAQAGAASEFDFEEVFGLPGPSPLAVVAEEGTDPDPWSEADAQALKVRSHSLVGPSPRPGLAWPPGRRMRDEQQEQLAGAASRAADGPAAARGPALSDSGDSGSEKGGEDEDGTGDSNFGRAGKLGPGDFELLACVGQGGFAKVFQCRKNGTSDIYAMKVMTKSKIIEKKHGNYMKAERDILTKVVHPFIVQLQYSFQTRTKLYLILDFINGGHLFFQLYRQGTFSEELARIYTAEIVCAVGHLHSMGIIHRDLKPENILIDAEGHVKLTDFGLAKEVDESIKSNSLCGTVEYMAPEIMLAHGHARAADWWSVGILLYEMLTGRPPFIHDNRHKLQQKIIKDKIKLPTFLTSEAITLLKGLLQKDPAKRLGSGVKGTDEIKHHKWFKSISWRKVEARELQPKFRPTVNGVNCIANFDEMWTKLPLQDSPATTPKGEDSDFFQGYTYVAPSPYLSGSSSDDQFE